MRTWESGSAIGSDEKKSSLVGNGATAVVFALTMIYFDVTQELRRARLKAFSVMKATMIRAVLVPALVIAFSTTARSGMFILAMSAFAYLFTALIFTREAWAGVAFRIDRAQFWRMAKAGLPLSGHAQIREDIGTCANLVT